MGQAPSSRNDAGDRTLDVAILGGRKFTGRWRPAKRTSLVSLIGGCHIDLREAEIPGDGITITRIALVGGTHVVAPPGLPVQVEGFSVLGGRRVDAGAEAGDPGAPLVRLRVFSFVGGLKVENRSGP
jgi:hypothetical protein